MNTRKLKHTYRLYKLKIKYEVIEMGKKLAVATALSGAIFLLSPIAGIAEPTTESVLTERKVEEAKGFWAKSLEVIGGAKDQAGGVWSSVVKVDKRLIRKDEQLKLAKEKIADLERELSKKRFVSGLELNRTRECLNTIGDFLDSQIEGK